jgi:4-methyl-5(b-hydroxyethyl)-thiazole monophosphate biosynthesis
MVKIMAKKALVFLAEGFEEVEAVTPIDYLRRAGIEVSTVSIAGGTTVTGAHGIPLLADTRIADITGLGGYDALLLPGGMPGATNLVNDPALDSLLKSAAKAGTLVCAICASPAVVLAPKGILAGRKFTCYPGAEEKVSGAAWSADPVVIDGNIITSRGPGTAARWAFAIIAALLDSATAEKIADATVSGDAR